MDRTRALAMTVNGEAVSRDVPVRINLVDFLRGELGLTGSHVGCEHGVCGACTVLVDGQSVRGCLMLAVQADGAEVTTVEGFAEAPGETGRQARALQQAFHRHNALQCGFCSPGMLASALELVQAGKTCDRAEIREHISGNYCRCTGYQAIVDAIEDVMLGRGGQ
ncbi:(2Fe-2S)-binding protein [Breoghania sp. L-A4]|uniref:(2Fe-2S)-binding protein n=1 Tax=Breoghania sp. L-A4 TaxID=2304600 RepID=UPI000E35AB62|nr:(2Fe-2S)-binding protein [Breoghania sp. L-A4]AXS42740.1 (2Fe-2S)-binding protein [Breoghania sp. L-A4]